MYGFASLTEKPPRGIYVYAAAAYHFIVQRDVIVTQHRQRRPYIVHSIVIFDVVRIVIRNIPRHIERILFVQPQGARMCIQITLIVSRAFVTCFKYHIVYRGIDVLGIHSRCTRGFVAVQLCLSPNVFANAAYFSSAA